MSTRAAMTIEECRALGDEMSERIRERTAAHGAPAVKKSDADAIVYSEPVETRTDGRGRRYSQPLVEARAADAAADGATYDPEEWMTAHLRCEREFMGQVIAEMLALLRDELSEEVHAPLRKAISAIELKLAELNGAVGVLRSLGLPPGIRLCGEFDPTAEYRQNDVVHHANGNSYIAREDRPGDCPSSEHWQLLVSRGERGREGRAGPPGPAGEKGERAPVPSIKSWHIDPRKYVASPLMSDGSVGAPLELRPLFQKFLDDVSGGKR